MLAELAQGAEEAARAAQELAKATGSWAAYLSAGVGAGIAIVGLGVGMGRIAGSANEGIARQPEAVADIRGTALIFAAMLEGATLFAVVVSLLLSLK